jgi:hypothetical protein
LAWCHHQNTSQCLIVHGADPLALNHERSPADADLAHTIPLIASGIAPAVRDRLVIHAVRHLGDQPALAARLLELLTARG